MNNSLFWNQYIYDEFQATFFATVYYFITTDQTLFLCFIVE